MRPVLFILPILLLVAACGGPSPVNSDPEDHAEIVDQSRREGTVVISLDTIFNAGVPHAVIRSEPEVLPGRAKGVGSKVWLLSGRQAIHIAPVVLYGDHYICYRFNDGSYVDTAYIAYHESMLADTRTIVTSRLLTRDSIDGAKAYAFVQAHPKPPYREPRRGEIVVRDKNQPIVINKGEIWQTGVRIGRYDSTSFAVAGFTFAQLSIYHVDTVHCATVTHGLAPADSVASLYTVRDKKSRDVKRTQGTPLLQTVLRYLVDQSYL